MENINLINTYNIAKEKISSAKANLVGEQMQSSAQNTNEGSVGVQNFSINQALMYNPQSALMDNEMILKYLQNLLMLPNSIDKFINDFISNNKNPKTLELLTRNLIDVKELTEFLNQNTKEALQKLLQTISLSLKSGIKDTSQMREILSILTVLQSKTDLNINTIKELLLLYIPINIQAFSKEVRFMKVDENLQEKINSSTISLMIETINFSNILCCINEDKNNLALDLYAAEVFPFDKFSLIVKDFSKGYLKDTSFNFVKIKQNNESGKIQNFKVVSQGFIPVNILLLAHFIIKIIFKIDFDFII